MEFLKLINKDILDAHSLYHAELDNAKAIFEAKIERLQNIDLVNTIANRPITYVISPSRSPSLAEEVVVYYKDKEISRESSQPDALRIAFDYFRSNKITPLGCELRIVITRE
jgi:hypothetical protein